MAVRLANAGADAQQAAAFFTLAWFGDPRWIIQPDNPVICRRRKQNRKRNKCARIARRHNR